MSNLMPLKLIAFELQTFGFYVSSLRFFCFLCRILGFFYLFSERAVVDLFSFL